MKAEAITVIVIALAVLAYIVYKFVRYWKYGIEDPDLIEYISEKEKGKMLIKMQWDNLDGVYRVLEYVLPTINKYPECNFQDWDAFKAWYKETVDNHSSLVELYYRTHVDADFVYCKENDPLYDPDAPDWEQFDRDHSHDFDPTLDYTDYSLGYNKKRRAAEDGFFTGIGLGATGLDFNDFDADDCDDGV